MKNSFVLYTNYFEILKDLDNADLGAIFRAILSYKTNGQYEIPKHLELPFRFIKNQLDIDAQKYKEFLEKQRLNGLKGGRPKTQKTQPFFKKPKLTQKTQTNLNDNVNDNDNVNVNVNVNDNVNVNTNRVPKARFTKPTKEEITDFAITNNLSTDMVDEYFDYYEGNGWKVGRNPMKDWKATYRRWCRNSFKSHKKDEIEEILNAGRDL